MVIPDMNTDTLASLIVVPDQTSKLFPQKYYHNWKDCFYTNTTRFVREMQQVNLICK